MGQSHPLATFIPIINDSPWTIRGCQTHRPSPGASHLTPTQQEAGEPGGALEGEASRRPSPSGDVVTTVTARTGQRVLKTSKQDTVASTVADASSQPDAPGARLRSDLGQPWPRCPSPVHGPARCRQEERRTDSDWKTSAGGRRAVLQVSSPCKAQKDLKVTKTSTARNRGLGAHSRQAMGAEPPPRLRRDWRMREPAPPRGRAGLRTRTLQEAAVRSHAGSWPPCPCGPPPFPVSDTGR